MPYASERKRVDHFETEIKMLLGQFFVQTATYEQDTTQGTDLILTLKPIEVRVGCRVRRHNVWLNSTWRNQFTIRGELPHGGKTEYHKIMEGWGDYAFYAIADESDIWIYHATLINLDVFRQAVRAGIRPCDTKLNDDRSSWMYAYTFSDFPSSIKVMEWHWNGEPKTVEKAIRARMNNGQRIHRS